MKLRNQSCQLIPGHYSKPTRAFLFPSPFLFVPSAWIFFPCAAGFFSLRSELLSQGLEIFEGLDQTIPPLCAYDGLYIFIRNKQSLFLP